jgi:hypothetical protein
VLAVRLHVDPVDQVVAGGLAAIRAEMPIEDLPATALGGRIDELVHGVVVDVGRDRTTVQLVHPAVVADIPNDSGIGLGDELRLRVVAADPVAREVTLEPIG